MPANIFLIIIGLIVLQRLIESYLPNWRKIPGRKSARWTWLAFSVTYPLLIIGSISEYFLLRKEINLWISAIGIIIVVGRIWLKWWAMLTLGKYWSVQIEIRETHKLIRNGPYRYLRHPAYLSNLLEYLGIPLIANAYFTLIGVLLVYLPLNLLRLHLEEKELLDKFGSEYENYQKEIWALVPFKWYFKSKTQ